MTSRPSFIPALHTYDEIGRRHAEANRGIERFCAPKSPEDISITLVRDTCSIAGVHTFLEDLYLYNPGSPVWLHTYLEQSLLSLCPSYVIVEAEREGGDHYTLHLCSQILLELAAAEARQAEMMMLALKCDGGQDWKMLSKCALWKSCSSPLGKTYRNPKTGSYVLRSKAKMWGIKREGGLFSLIVRNRLSSSLEALKLCSSMVTEHDRSPALSPGASTLGSSDDAIERDVEPDQYSLLDYERAYSRCGGDSRMLMRQMLGALLERFAIISRDTLEEAQAWTVQLHYDLGIEEDGRFLGMYELYTGLRRLLAAALSAYQI